MTRGFALGVPAALTIALALPPAGQASEATAAQAVGVRCESVQAGGYSDARLR
jgi:hypothetical protein